MVFMFVFAALTVPRDVGEGLQQAIDEINKCGFSQGPKISCFDTRQRAVDFAERIKNLEGVVLIVEPVPSLSNSEDYELGPDKYVVSYTGYKKKGKEGETLSDFFKSVDVTGKDYSPKSRIDVTHSGDELLDPAEDRQFALDQSQKDVDASRKTREVMQQTVANLFLAYRNMPRNIGSMGQLEYAVRITLKQLAEKMGFTSESAIVDFLKTGQGGTFIAELEAAALEGKFYISGSASSEWMSNQWVARKNRGIKYEFSDNALDRCQMALDFINGWMREAGREEISSPFVPTVYLIVKPTETVRSNLIDAGVQKFSERCKNPDAIAKVREYLEAYYSDTRIAENCNRFGNYIYSLVQKGDAEAIDAWDRLTSGKSPALSYTVKDDGTIECRISNESKADTLFSWGGGLRKKGGILEEALSEGDSRSAGFSLQENVTLGIKIMDQEKQKFEAGKDGAISLSVSQTFIDRDGTKRTGAFTGKVLAKIYEFEPGREQDAKEVQTTVSDVVDGMCTVSFKPQAGKTYSFIAYAYNSDDKGKLTIDSGRVKETVKVEEEANAYTSEVVKGEDVRTYHGETATVHFDSYKLTRDKEGNELKKESTASRFAFGLKLGGTQIEEFVNPYEATEKNNQWVQRVGDFEIPIDRKLVCESTKEKYELVELKQWVKDGKVGRKFLDSRGGVHYFTLDGKNEFKIGGEGSVSLEGADGKLHEMEGFKVDGDFIVDMKNKGKNYETDRDVASFNRQANRVEPGKMSMKFYLQNSIAMPREDGRDIVMGDKTFTANEIRDKLLDGTIAFVANASVEVENYGKIKTAVIFGPDGRVLGELSKMEQPLPSVRNLFLYHPNSGDMGFDMNVHFPENSDASEIKIYPYTEFVLGRKIRVSAQK